MSENNKDCNKTFKNIIAKELSRKTSVRCISISTPNSSTLKNRNNPPKTTDALLLNSRDSANSGSAIRGNKIKFTDVITECDDEKQCEALKSPSCSNKSMSTLLSEGETDALANTLVNIIYNKVSAKIDRNDDTPRQSFDANVELTAMEKIEAIQKALIYSDHKLLKTLALSKGGLINNQMRCTAWLFMHNIDYDEMGSVESNSQLTENHKNHRDYKLVEMDVARTLKRYPPGMDQQNRLDMQDGLITMIMDVLVDHTDLHYYQGFHDICVTLQLCLGEGRATILAKQLATTKLRMFMEKDMTKTNEMLFYIIIIVKNTLPELATFLEKSEVGTIYALPMIITWFAHCLPDIDSINRLFDAFVCCESMYPIYLMAAIVIYRQKQIMEVDCEMTAVHEVLTSLPSDLPYDNLLANATILMKRLPPRSLRPLVADLMKQKQRADDEYRERMAEAKLRRERIVDKRSSSTNHYGLFTIRRMTIFGISAIVLLSVWYGRKTVRILD